MVWNDNRSGIMQTYYCRSTDFGATWGSEIPITHTTVFSYCPMVNVNGNDVDAVCADRRTGPFEIYYMHSSDNGSTWANEIQMTNAGVGYLYPYIERDGQNLHLIWWGQGFFYKLSKDGGTTWTADTCLVGSANKPGMGFLSLSGSAIHTIWTDQRDGHTAIYYKRNPSGNAKETGNSISIGSVPTQFCPGESFEIPYGVTGNYTPDNMFIAQLSDSIGDFANALELGKINSSSSGTISALIPKTIPSGFGYRIRIISLNPPVVSPDNKSDLIINPLPVPLINGKDTVCYNEIVQYYSSSIIGHSKKWKVSGGTVIGSSNNDYVIIQWGMINPGTLTLIETITETGCSDTLIESISINPVPEPYIMGSNNICNRSSAYYGSSMKVGDSYAWIITGGYIIGDSTGNNINVYWDTNDKSGIVMLKETNISSGCFMETSKTVTVNSVPEPEISGVRNVCYFSIYDYSSAFVAGHTYKWEVNGGDIIGDVNENIIKVQWTTTKNYSSIKLVETNSQTGCNDSNWFYTEIHELPDVQFTGLDKVCSGDTAIFTTEAPKGETIKWLALNGNILNGDNQSEVLIKWLSAPSGTLTLIKTNDTTGCSLFNTKIIDIKSKPIPKISGPITANQNSEERYSVKEIPGSEYLWQVTGGSILIGNDKTEVNVLWGNSTEGKLVVTETDENSCNGTDELVVQLTPVSVDEISGNNKFIVYPNPASDYIEISVRTIHELPQREIKIYNIFGQCVINYKLPITNYNKNLRINISHLPNGMYFLRYDDEIFKLIVLR